ncbi:hypothetical protein CC86DRAFT_400668 [Ophiobolus disseminans]|uniref:Uncharacterized protein n=1 Tax=Ophiobolus disseminans TaxID=1469910 RepID=A0A6A7AG50_9PLEO|nr:hypothetical protein CC86DRAFT_400668 [Ophiobolus disseminans]
MTSTAWQSPLTPGARKNLRVVLSFKPLRNGKVHNGFKPFGFLSDSSIHRHSPSNPYSEQVLHAPRTTTAGSISLKASRSLTISSYLDATTNGAGSVLTATLSTVRSTHHSCLVLADKRYNALNRRPEVQSVIRYHPHISQHPEEASTWGHTSYDRFMLSAKHCDSTTSEYYHIIKPRLARL